MRLGRLAISALLLAAAAPSTGSAQEAVPFYQGKTIRIVISTGVAGGYAEYARLLADHMGAHIAGQPNFIVQSMPGAGGLLATNYLYTQAPQDGTTIRHRPFERSARPVVGQQGRPLRSPEVQLARQPRSDRRHVHRLAHVADQDLGRHAAARIHRRSSGAGSQMDILSGDAQQDCSEPSSRWWPATRTAPTSIWRWSAARSRAAAAGSSPRSSPRARNG